MNLLSNSVLSGFNTTAWILIPLFIFLARVCDVSIGTLRIILISKGYRFYSAALGFVEVFIWITAVSQIMLNLHNFYYYFVWALGFATGTYVGVTIERRISLGQLIVRVITRFNADNLIEFVKSKNYHFTHVDAIGNSGNVKVLYIVIKRQNLYELIDNIKNYNPNAFYTVEDVRIVSEGYFPKRNFGWYNHYLPLKKMFVSRK
ncbi:MAG: hypothetical protein A2475_03085 [Ignavibacteria bacterium RIFOXYC2_FULL_35_21]|nr:MAG: hypothetical protein A2220_03900 [Ignavibacteria bacterium RIFOXYA2_FULL_35_10]OGV23637.1 MAG: hypothetical protein A2475_03085 [Ignavibacteria bacterium RIFOXYC2_FULL_35_21]